MELFSFHDSNQNEEANLSYWKYVARATVTNPRGTTLDGESCKQEKLGEYLYDWRTKEHSLSCEYIDFQW